MLWSGVVPALARPSSERGGGSVSAGERPAFELVGMGPTPAEWKQLCEVRPTTCLSPCARSFSAEFVVACALQECWAAEPQRRPTFEAIAETLRLVRPLWYSLAARHGGMPAVPELAACILVLAKRASDGSIRCFLNAFATVVWMFAAGTAIMVVVAN